MDIHELLNRKVQISPMPSAPSVHAPSKVHFGSPSLPISQTPRPMGEDDDSARSSPYTLMDDLSIFRVVSYYYGPGFRGKIPWSFWQTYKRATGSVRSTSSLYHHWNGAMKKKYDCFISSGRLLDCIHWLEVAVMTDQSHHICQSEMPHTGLPLCHSMSGPSVSLAGHSTTPRPLTRTASCFAEKEFPFAHLPRY